jgi:hypothetical protein
MMIDALMYGFTPRSDDREAREAAAGQQVQEPKRALFWRYCWSWA